MVSRSRSPRSGTAGRQVEDSELQSEEPRLEHLRRRFVSFRQQRKGQTPVPDDLRAEVLAALDQGLTRRQMRQTCGVTSSQIDDWRQRKDKPVSTAAAVTGSARIFSVVDDPPIASGGSCQRVGPDELELRLGDWSIRLRLEVP